MNESAQSQIGERLRLFREMKKMSQVQMAAALDATTRGLQNNELNISLPNSKMLIALYALGMNINWLLSGKGPMLLADAQPILDAPMAVDAENLGHAIAAVEQIAAARCLTLSPSKRGKLASLVYQYFLLDKTENETTAYLQQLMELVSD